MNLNILGDSPFSLQISFHKLIEHFEEVAATQSGPRAAYARAILDEVKPFPELRNGITHRDQIINNAKVISDLLEILFPEALTDNEIKAVTIPFQDILFNQTRRFQNILKSAGEDFNISFRDFNENQFYIMACCIILDEHYGTHLNFTKPLYFDIPTADGVIKHYRILYNAEFLELVPTDKAVALTQDDIDQLVDNYNNIDLWKAKFPVGSWVLRGFAVTNLYDSTVESAVSSLKGTLLGREGFNSDIHKDIESVFRSIYRIPDLRVGFINFDADERKFSLPNFGNNVRSFLMPEDLDADFCNEELCMTSLSNVVTDKVYFTVSDISKFLHDKESSALAQRLHEQNIRSMILAPIIKDGRMLGIIETGIKQKRAAEQH